MKCFAGRTARARREQRGVALVLSLLLVMVCASLGAAFTQFASASARRQSHAVAQLQAFYVAEASLAEAFFSVRMGRNGAIASAATPAHFGGAEIWVEIHRTDDDALYLRSTARRGRSEVVLGLIVAPEQPPLGFFSDEDLLIDQVLLIDGFDSREGTHAEEVARIEALLPPMPRTASRGNKDSEQVAMFTKARTVLPTFLASVPEATLQAVLENQITIRGQGYVLDDHPIDLKDYLDKKDYQLFMRHGIYLTRTHLAGVLFTETLEITAPAPDSSPLLAETSGQTGWSFVPPDSPERLKGHTLSGALLGSNGNISFARSAGAVEIHGSVTPGVNGTVVGSDSLFISGSTESRTIPADLPAVVVPDLVSSGNWSITNGIPAVLSTPTARFGTVDIGPGEELLLRGPMVLVVDDLTLADGARLALDTAAGPVDMYVRNSMQLSPTSFIDSTAAAPRDVCIQAEGNDLGTSHLTLEAIGAFHGTICAPRSEVTLGTNFEVFGSVVAQRLIIQAGARLHFDDESYDGELPIPKMVSWRILELPDSSVVRPANANSVADLAASHDIVDVNLRIEYTDLNGNRQKYSGLESDFNYAQVGKVISTQRKSASATAAVVTPDWHRGWVRRVLETVAKKRGHGR